MASAAGEVSLSLYVLSTFCARSCAWSSIWIEPQRTHHAHDTATQLTAHTRFGCRDTAPGPRETHFSQKPSFPPTSRGGGGFLGKLGAYRAGASVGIRCERSRSGVTAAEACVSCELCRVRGVCAVARIHGGGLVCTVTPPPLEKCLSAKPTSKARATASKLAAAPGEQDRLPCPSTATRCCKATRS
jgi:hypothetical protein